MIRLRMLHSPLPLMAFAIVLALSVPARAQQLTLELDPAKTRIEFTLDAFLHTVHGTMKLSQGNIEVDPGTGKAAGRFVADARSAETGNDGRDNKMHKEILESDKYDRGPQGELDGWGRKWLP